MKREKKENSINKIFGSMLYDRLSDVLQIQLLTYHNDVSQTSDDMN